MNNRLSINLRRDQYLELEKIHLGAFEPLDHFMTENEYLSVCLKMRLPNGFPFSLPVVLDVNKEIAMKAINNNFIDLIYENIKVGEIEPESVYTCDKSKISIHIYGTNDISHPGVNMFYNSGDWFIGGKTILLERIQHSLSKYELTPEDCKLNFKKLGWKTIVGFQTRNVPHRAHEYLQRVALEHVDGLFVQPLLGQKKSGDYTAEAIIKGYEILFKEFYPKSTTLFGILTTSMRYAGPREALFHAIIRKNYGCTHFIIGRDHAGVSDFYEKYESHNLLKKYENEIGIKIMYLHGPFYCDICDGIVTEHTCPHIFTNKENTHQISGTMIREMLNGGIKPNIKFIRSEILEALNGCKLFID